MTMYGEAADEESNPVLYGEAAPEADSAPIAKLKRVGKQAVASVLDVGGLPFLYNLLGKGTEKLGVTLPGAEAAGELSHKLENWANETAGTTPAEDTADAVGRVGGMLIPVPGNFIKAIPGIAQLISKAPKTMNAVGNVAEVVTPFVPNPSAGRFIANAAVGTGIFEGANALTNNPNYTSLFPNVGQDRPQAATVYGEPHGEIPTAYGEPAPSPAESNGFWSEITPTNAGLALIGIAGGAKVIHSMLRQPKPLRTDTIAAPADDALKYGTATTPHERTVTETLDHTYAPVSQIRRTAGEAAAKDAEETFDLFTGAGGTEQVKVYLNTGELPGGHRGVALKDVQLEAEQLRPDQVDKLSKGMLAQDIIESRAYIRKQTNNSTLRTDLPGWSDADAFKHYTAMMADPDALKLSMKIRQSMNDALLWAAKEGNLISMRDFYKFTNKRSLYVPMLRAGEELGDKAFDMLRKRTMQEDKGASEVLNILSASEEYITSILKRAMDNKATLKAVDYLAYGRDPLVTKAMKLVAEAGPNTVKVFREGKKELWDFQDPMMARSLELNPRMAHNIATQSKAVVQLASTGLTPWTAIRSLFWDPQMAALNKGPERTYGPLSWAVDAASGGKLRLPIGDPLAMLSTGAGVVRTAGARLAQHLSDNILTDLNTSTGIWKHLDSGLVGAGVQPGLTRKVADAMRDAYLNSVYHAFEKGGQNSTMLRSDLTQTSQLLDSVTHSFKDTRTGQRFGEMAGPLWNFYKAAIDTMHVATKVQYLKENMHRAPIETLLKESRTITGGDPTKRGLGRVHNAETSMKGVNGVLPKIGNTLERLGNEGAFGVSLGSMAKFASNYVPWANPSMQGAANMFRTISRDGWSYPIAASPIFGLAVASAVLNSSISDEHTESYWNMPSWMRIGSIYLPFGDGISDSLKFPLSPENVMINAVAQHATEALLNLRQGHYKTPFGEDVLEVLSATYGFPMPPPAQAVLAVGGIDQNFNQMRDSPVRPGYVGVASLVPQRVQEIWSSLTGTTGQILIATGDAMNGAPKGKAMEYGWGQLALQVKSRMPLVSTLWAGPLESAANAESRTLNQKLGAIENIQEALRNTDPRSGRVVPIESPTNPRFNERARELSYFFGRNPEIISLKQEIKSVTNQIANGMDPPPQDKQAREAVSYLRRDLRRLRTRLSDMIQSAENYLGMKLEELDPSK